MANTKDRFQPSEEQAYQNYMETIGIFHRCIRIQPAEINDAGEILAERLRYMLKARKMTQTDLEKISGSSHSTVSNICNNNGHSKSINIKRVELYAAILQCTPHYLLGISNHPSSFTVIKDCFVPADDLPQRAYSNSAKEWTISSPTAGESLGRFREVDKPTPFVTEERTFAIYPIAYTEIALSNMIREIGRKDPVFVGYLVSLYESNKLENLKTILIHSGLLNTTDPEESYRIAMERGKYISSVSKTHDALLTKRITVKKLRTRRKHRSYSLQELTRSGLHRFPQKRATPKRKR